MTFKLAMNYIFEILVQHFQQRFLVITKSLSNTYPVQITQTVLSIIMNEKQVSIRCRL
jgi:hypothetical protein